MPSPLFPLPFFSLKPVLIPQNLDAVDVSEIEMLFLTFTAKNRKCFCFVEATLSHTICG